MIKNNPSQPPDEVADTDGAHETDKRVDDKPKEIGGPKGPEPTRYGDWEKAGRCIDF